MSLTTARWMDERAAIAEAFGEDMALEPVPTGTRTRTRSLLGAADRDRADTPAAAIASETAPISCSLLLVEFAAVCVELAEAFMRIAERLAALAGRGAS